MNSPVFLFYFKESTLTESEQKNKEGGRACPTSAEAKRKTGFFLKHNIWYKFLLDHNSLVHYTSGSKTLLQVRTGKAPSRDDNDLERRTASMWQSATGSMTRSSRMKSPEESKDNILSARYPPSRSDDLKRASAALLRNPPRPQGEMRNPGGLLSSGPAVDDPRMPGPIPRPVCRTGFWNRISSC